ncbi:minor capsid protein [Capybara microvirus Cap3_SP_383]|nr:minor capsid protein [Capybara microvirus Cap3_SP_383]
MDFTGVGSSILGAATGGLFNLIGGLFGKSESQKIAEMNMQMQRETNELNYKMFHEQQDWNLDMWNKQNEYNTAVNQKDRLLKAGLNPLFYSLDGTNAGGINNVTPVAAQAPRADNDGPQIMAQSFANIGNIAADTMLKQAQANSLNANADNLKEDTRTKEINNATLAIRNGNDIRMQNITISRQVFARNNLDEQQAKLLGEQCVNLNASTQALNESVAQGWEKLRLESSRQDLDKYLATQKLTLEERKLANDLYVAMQNLALNREEQNNRNQEQQNRNAQSTQTLKIGDVELDIKVNERTISGNDARKSEFLYGEGGEAYYMFSLDRRLKENQVERDDYDTANYELDKTIDTGCKVFGAVTGFLKSAKPKAGASSGESSE